MITRLLPALILLLLALLGLPFLRTALTPNNALTVWFLEDDPQLQEYRAFHRQFGNDEVVVLAVQDEKSLFRPQKLQQLKELTERLERLPGIARVYSISNAQTFGHQNGKLVPETQLPDTLPAAETGLRQLQYRATHSVLYTGRLIDSTGRTALLLAQMEVMQDIDSQRDAVIQRVREVATQVLGPEQVHLGGLGVIYAGLNHLTQYDFGLFVSLSYLLMFGLLWLLYRRVALVLLPIGAVLTATLLTLELYGALGYQVNMITMMLPTLIILLGIADCLHILNEYHHLSSHSASGTPDKATLTKLALKHSFQPCLYTSLTTAAGFLSLAFSPMAVLRELGCFAALGIMLCFVCSFVFSAALLPGLSFQGPLNTGLGWLPLRLQLFLEALQRRQAVSWSLVAGLLLVLGYGATRVITDTYTLGYLPAQHPVVQDHAFLQKSWGDYVPLEFTVRPLGSRKANDPEVLQAMHSFVQEASQLPEVSNGFGLHTFYEALLPEVYGPAHSNQLQSKSAIRMVTRQALRHNPLLLAQLADTGFTVARMTLTGKMLSAAKLDTALQKAAAISAKHFHGVATVTATGYPPLYARIVAYVMQSQKQSFGLAVILVFGLMLLLLRSLKLAILSVLPNLFPVLLLMAVMGFFSIQLDIATAMVAAIVIGFSIDDTIHLSYHYQRFRREGVRMAEALQEAWAFAGNAVVLSSVIIFAGFLVLLFASVRSVFYFGLLTSVAIVGELFAQLVLFPLLLLAFDGDGSGKIVPQKVKFNISRSRWRKRQQVAADGKLL